MSNYFIVVSVLFLCLTSVCDAATGSGFIKIQSVEVSESFFTIYSASGDVANDNCEDASKIVFWRVDYPNGFDSMLSTALSAHLANKRISMWLDGCKAGPWGKKLPKASTIVISAT
jgi:hypothetical protein